jgi:hypothetical protein
MRFIEVKGETRGSKNLEVLGHCLDIRDIVTYNAEIVRISKEPVLFCQFFDNGRVLDKLVEVKVEKCGE